MLSKDENSGTCFEVMNVAGKGKVLREGRLVCEVEYDLAVSGDLSRFRGESTVRGYLFTGGAILPRGVQHDLELHDGRMVGFVPAGTHIRFTGELH